MSKKAKLYPSDVSDEEWEFCAPYLTLLKEEAPQRTHSLRQVYNALRWLVQDAAQHGMHLEVVKHHEAKRGFVLLPRRWVVERSFGWAARFRRLARDYERLATTMAGYHWIAFAILMLQSLFRKS